MLDKSIPYYNVLMERKKGTPLFQYDLPEGFRFVLFKPGDEKAWAEIETSVLEFDKEADALYYFRESYMTYMDELIKRCFFIEDREGKKVATLTVWWTFTGARCDPWIHWVAVKPEYQGLGLGKALVSKGMKHLVEMEGDRNAYLHTQTWSYKAIEIYKKAGFEITKKKGLGGYENDEYEQAVKLLSHLNRWDSYSII